MIGLIAYDCKLYRPACVLVAATLGADTELAHEFPTDLWLLHPTPDMKVYEVPDRAFLDALVQISRSKNVCPRCGFAVKESHDCVVEDRPF